MKQSIIFIFLMATAATASARANSQTYNLCSGSQISNPSFYRYGMSLGTRDTLEEAGADARDIAFSRAQSECDGSACAVAEGQRTPLSNHELQPAMLHYGGFRCTSDAHPLRTVSTQSISGVVLQDQRDNAISIAVDKARAVCGGQNLTPEFIDQFDRTFMTRGPMNYAYFAVVVNGDRGEEGLVVGNPRSVEVSGVYRCK